MAPFPAPETGILLTHFIVSEEIARSRDFYANVLGGEVVSESPAVVALANSWIIGETHVCDRGVPRPARGKAG